MLLWTIIIFILILTVIVIIHEGGHFLAAKKFGVRVREFGIGLPPKATKLFRCWETDFVLNWIPMGGCVSMDGEDADCSTLSTNQINQDQGKFYAKPAWQRFLIILAGPLTNLLTALLIFIIVYGALGVPEKIDQAVFISSVAPDSPAATAKMVPEVRILSLSNEAGETSAASNRDQVANFIHHSQGQQIIIVTTGPCQQGQCQAIEQVYHANVRTDEQTPTGSGNLGVGLTQYQTFFYPWPQQIFKSTLAGIEQSYSLAKEMIISLGQALKHAVFGEKNHAVLMGPVGIVDELNEQQTFAEGGWAVLQFIGLLSLNLGIINLLPLPALDGGRLVMIIGEKFVGRKKVAKLENSLNYFGFIFIIGLTILITSQDIWRVVTGG